MSEPWAHVRVSIEQPGRDVEEVWVGSVAIYPGDDIGERLKAFLEGWARSTFKAKIEETWEHR